MSPSEIGAEDTSDFERDLRADVRALCDRVGWQCLSCSDCVTDSDVFDVAAWPDVVAEVRLHVCAWCRRSRPEFATDNECDGWEGRHE